MEKERMPIIGDKFPKIEADTTHGKINIPGDYMGKWFVLFSHPADFTPVCTTEFYAFQKRYEYFKELDCELIGLSIDQVFSHIKWIEWIGQNLGQEIKFPVIADDQGKIAESLNMVHPQKGSNTVRAVFIVDNLGVIRTILYYPQELGRNIDEILRIVKSLQISEQKGVAIPANWPNNEIIGSKGIIPPPKDEKTAKERLEKSRRGEIECKDWWFCYKKIFDESDYELEDKNLIAEKENNQKINNTEPFSQKKEYSDFEERAKSSQKYPEPKTLLTEIEEQPEKIKENTYSGLKENSFNEKEEIAKERKNFMSFEDEKTSEEKNSHSDKNKPYEYYEIKTDYTKGIEDKQKKEDDERSEKKLEEFENYEKEDEKKDKKNLETLEDYEKESDEEIVKKNLDYQDLEEDEEEEDLDEDEEEREDDYYNERYGWYNKDKTRGIGEETFFG